ncbi:DUF4340 domain-containing protein [Acidobacteria bacterium AH-259-D05]|nr:DUF4340 domain-containing protein [Acidobacteria bacterium AH-259-D05]
MKKLILLLAIFLALGTFVYFYEIKGGEEREEARRLEESLLRLKQDEITAVEISRPQEETILLNKVEDRWVIKHPIETSADTSTVGSLLRDLESASRERSFPDAGWEAKKYGLHNPRITLAIETGKEQRTLLIGSEDFTGNSMYVQFEGGSEVFLTSTNLFTAADKKLLQWRNKKILEFERSQVHTIEIANSEGQVRLKRQEEDWFLEAPLGERADQNKVSSLLSAIEFGEAQEFVSDQPEERNSYDLERPRATLRIQLENQEKWRALELGQEQGEYYLARNPDRPFVFTVKQEVFEKLNQTVWDFRDKTVVDVEQSQIAQILFRRGEDEEIAIRHKDYTWTIEKPDSHKDQEALAYQFWYPINDIEFNSIDDEKSKDESFSNPDVEMTITHQDGSKRAFDFVQAGDQYLARNRESGRQGTISKEDFEKLHFKIEDIL